MQTYICFYIFYADLFDCKRKHFLKAKQINMFFRFSFFFSFFELIVDESDRYCLLLIIRSAVVK